MRLGEDDVVLVTGGASGLGEATVRALLTTGAQAVVVDLPGSRGEALVAALGERAVFAPADVRDPDQLAAAVAVATGRGTLRVAVSCAGVATPGRVVGRKGVLPLADFARVVEINLLGTFNLLRLAADAMGGNGLLDGDRGLVVMTASVAAFDGQVGQAAYAASKGGVAALTLPAARDLADRAVRVMTIAPGVMETPMMAGLPEETRTSLEALVPHPARLGRPAEYAQLVEALVANPLLNGEAIRLDGALRMPPR
ncbi:SDR family NAD(P)-dependent oxidoreductase [Microlunatus capsulatus]|uniref:NAD(P)-dependent dehydrogenase (Short-subunit alcohol dehydrogenase family) n=1 Tax=Microlunatus capsulatus TaxID=99117 RepID=A0ABS4ZA14_9ACTN|nr:SDR family NAD(P)-dependent oxidoreductase [Microlunatus capsulatus]MBP2417888.1 NAD(P)-dependent dehydrogenase (short-subunit alcohol dehydrogenase family) [Microlunatus capsulatus]